MAATSQQNDGTDNVVAFPKLGGKSPADQLSLIRAAKATAMLAAIVRKYGALSITVDEIADGHNYRPYIAHQARTNSWSIDAQRNDQHEPIFPTSTTGQ